MPKPELRPMDQPRKLAIIGHCGACPHYLYRRSKLSGACGKQGKQVQFGYGKIPDWCPLPDAKEEAIDATR